MRENRTYGSEGGEALPSRPLSTSRARRGVGETDLDAARSRRSKARFGIVSEYARQPGGLATRQSTSSSVIPAGAKRRAGISEAAPAQC